MRLMFMQSNGGLTDSSMFQGKDSILSGPAGGVVGAARTSRMAGLDKIIAFDMGGTSTDVSHFAGEFERSLETEVAGVRMRAPMLYIHTVAAGGGSILHFDGARYRVGPDSAGADPGPACYRRGGPLTITDCNVMLGRIVPRFFRACSARDRMSPWTIGWWPRSSRFSLPKSRPRPATGALPKRWRKDSSPSPSRTWRMQSRRFPCNGDTTFPNMRCAASAALEDSTPAASPTRSACEPFFIHPHAGVLSAYGMGLADIVAMRERSIETRLDETAMESLTGVIAALEAEAVGELREQIGTEATVTVERRVLIRYDGTDSALTVDFDAATEMTSAFEALHRQRYGFVTPDKPLILEAAVVEALGGAADIEDPQIDQEGEDRTGASVPRIAETLVFMDGGRRTVPVVDRAGMLPGDIVEGPAIIVEPHGTNVVEDGWQARLTSRGHLMLDRRCRPRSRSACGRRRIRSCSRCSTTCSCRSRSRWEPR